MKVNIGCGEFRAEGWLNIDMVETDAIKPDRVCDLFDLPDDLVYLTSVYCGHVMEHVPTDRIVEVLADLRDRMVSRAQIACVGPDIYRATKMYEAGRLDEATWRECHAGVGDKKWFGDYHYWACNEAELMGYMLEAGFTDVHAVPLESAELNAFPVTSRAPWQCAVIGLA